MNTPTNFPTFEAPPTRYTIMSLQANEAPSLDNHLAALYSWITLAGFVVLPATFTSLKNSGNISDSKGGRVVQDAVQNVSLLALAGLGCLVGTIGSCWLWRKWRNNYIWLLARIFLPGLRHSIVGLATTLINIYTAKGGHWSVTAKLTIVIVGLYLGATSMLTLVYDNWLLEKIKTPHDRELAQRTTQ